MPKATKKYNTSKDVKSKQSEKISADKQAAKAAQKADKNELSKQKQEIKNQAELEKAKNDARRKEEAAENAHQRSQTKKQTKTDSATAKSSAPSNVTGSTLKGKEIRKAKALEVNPNTMGTKSKLALASGAGIVLSNIVEMNNEQQKYDSEMEARVAESLSNKDGNIVIDI